MSRRLFRRADDGPRPPDLGRVDPDGAPPPCLTNLGEEWRQRSRGERPGRQSEAVAHPEWTRDQSAAGLVQDSWPYRAHQAIVTAAARPARQSPRPDLFTGQTTPPRAAPALPAQAHGMPQSSSSSSSARPAKRDAPATAAAAAAVAQGRHKRRRLYDNDNDPHRSGGTEEIVEEVDLVSQDPEDVKAALEAKQRLDQVELQKKDDADGDGPKRFQDMSCIICMDEFTDLTATPCGHIFCHECLTQALMAGERGDRGTGSCPVCRKTLKRTTKNHVIPLALMTRAKYDEVQQRA